MTGDSGSAPMLWFLLVPVIAVVAVATAGLGLAYSARTQAQVASDAAALAAAAATYPPAADVGPLLRARSAAAANGAVLASCRCPVDSSLQARTVTVVTYVTVDTPLFGSLRLHAGSRAEFDPRLWLGR